MSGLIFNGPQIKKLIRDSSLDLLQRQFEGESVEAKEDLRVLIQYLKSLRELYNMVCRKKLSEDFRHTIQDFREKFDICYGRKLLYETPKV